MESQSFCYILIRRKDSGLISSEERETYYGPYGTSKEAEKLLEQNEWDWHFISGEYHGHTYDHCGVWTAHGQCPESGETAEIIPVEVPELRLGSSLPKPVLPRREISIPLD